MKITLVQVRTSTGSYNVTHVYEAKYKGRKAYGFSHVQALSNLLAVVAQ